MSYTKILRIQIAAKEAYEDGQLTAQQYMNILDDLENDLLKIDIKQAHEDFNQLIKLYT